MNAIATRLAATTSITRTSLGGLAIGIAGLVVQWIAEPTKFPGFPPGILAIVACGVFVVLTARHWWSPIFAVLIGAWVSIGGFFSGELTGNLDSENTGTVLGNVVMIIGLVIATIAGALAALHARRMR